MRRNRTGRARGALLLAAALLLALTGCGTFSSRTLEELAAAEEDTGAESGQMTVVGFSQLGSESVWRTVNTNSVQRELTGENGYFLLYNNARQKQENQIKALRGFISQRVDYIVFSPVTENGWDTVLEEAKEAGIPVIVMDRMVNVKDESLFTAWVGTDMREEGCRAGRWLETYLRRTGRLYEDLNIVVLEGTDGSSAQTGRGSGFDSIAARYGNWHILEKRSGEFTTTKGKEVMEDFLKKYPQIDVVVSQNDDMTFGALEAMRESGRLYSGGHRTIVISFDAVEEALELVRDGQIQVDVECNPDQGAYVREIIEKLEAGETVEKYHYVDEQVYTLENLPESGAD